jgi:hypothetical protein
VSRDRVRSGQFSPARPCVSRQDQTAQNDSRRGPDHCGDLGTRDLRVSRFRTSKHAISYCGLCGDERSSADKVMRMPLSKQRNKYIQRTPVEAARRQGRVTNWLWSMRGKSKKRKRQSGDTCRGPKVGHISACRRSKTRLACGRGRDLGRIILPRQIKQDDECADCQVPGEPTGRRRSYSRGSLRIVPLCLL